MHERLREARGKVLMVTRRRAQLGLPAHVLARWTPVVKRARRVARREVGIVRYIGTVKRVLEYGDVPLEKNLMDDIIDEVMWERLVG
jgi:hypothetical protein